MARKRGNPRGKKINPTLFVFCEGETEEAYINMLKSLFRLPSIQISAKIGGNKIDARWINSYKRDKPTHKKDVNYLLYDGDVPAIYNRLKEIPKCTLLISNPCIEFWFLLHYKNHKSVNECGYFCRQMTNRNKGYVKGQINDKLKAQLSTKYEQAVERAKEIIGPKNPSSTVYALIENLIDLKK